MLLTAMLLKKKMIYLTALLLTFAFSADASNPATNPDPPMKVIYLFDPLCGWCYGFSDVINAFIDAHQDIEVEIVAGGMVVGERVGPLSDIAPYLRSAYKNVEDRTGVKFGAPYLEELFGEATMEMNSEPPSRALASFKLITGDERAAFAYAAAIHRMIYEQGHAPGDIEALTRCAVDLGVNAAHFNEVYHSAESETLMRAGFLKSDALGVSGFPTVLLSDGQGLAPLARGYVDLPSLSQQFLHNSAR